MTKEAISETQSRTGPALSHTTGRKNEAVTIKGTAGGLLIRLRDDQSADFQAMLGELGVRLKSGEKFFRGARTALDLGKRELEAADLDKLQELFKEYEVRLEHIVSGANVTRNLVKQAGIEFKFPNNRNTRPPVPDLGAAGPETAIENGNGAGMAFDTAEALFMRRTLRSGQVIRHHADVCLLGDVNPGAEIIAGGNIIVWGSLRGAVWAGAVKTGDKDGDNRPGSQAVVCALQLNAMQLSIGEMVTHAPENAATTPPLGPEIAYIAEGQIIVEPWLPGKKILRGAS